ncbi:hypothetical protein WJX74_004620 [Apatococcus lobatus]|uniref:Acetyl-coenzyme A transporter 1 n=1 Tax=Apatococcus lobatus TaxID=904363 RepID=A0AAW1R1R2_9CHLO
MAPRAGKRRNTSGSNFISEPIEEGLPEGAFDIPKHHAAPSQGTLLKSEGWNMILLSTLYLMQGVPLGLTMGSMPFLLQSKASYTQIGIFSVASYPYSFKLFWSPIVDSIYSLAFGRRKSWVVPIQLVSAAMLVFCSGWAQERLAAADVGAITALFFVLVLLAATQDIAVDGWALTLLSRKHIGYASTCQTVGMNIGYFTSFTVFLALNDVDFSNKYLRSTDQSQGILPLGAYLRFWGWFYAVLTVLIALFKSEVNFRPADEDISNLDGEPDKILSVWEAYAQLWRVIKLPAVRRLSVILLTFRLGMLPAEQAAPLKLLEKGVSKEALAGLVLLEFPCEVVGAILAGRWAASASPLQPWFVGYRLRLAMAAAVTCLVYKFPSNAASLSDHPGAFLLLAAAGLMTSFTSTVMFTAVGSFYNKISDPDMGGAYLTLLNTIANMGITLPKLAIFACMDLLTFRRCQSPSGTLQSLACPGGRVEAQASNACTDAGGTCSLIFDGFYPLSAAMICLGVVLSFHYKRAMPQLEALPRTHWRAPAGKRN